MKRKKVGKENNSIHLVIIHYKIKYLTINISKKMYYDKRKKYLSIIDRIVFISQN